MTTDSLALNSNKTNLSAWIWRVLMVLAAAGVISFYADVLTVYEVAIIIITAIGMAVLGQNWPGYRWHTVAVAAFSLFAVSIYGNDLAAADSSFWLNYLLASQSAFMWMSALFVMATVTYFCWLAVSLRVYRKGRQLSDLVCDDHGHDRFDGSLA